MQYRNYSRVIIIAFTFILGSCVNGQKHEEKMDYKYTNDLIHENSPYLLQHAHNPVNWHAWNKETLELAKRENKPILVSIGYSSCHWCHVMEHQSFEDEAIAKIMNEHFICIKVDREEHPDIDQIYMSAVQLMTGSGGWPLNCFALPDGRPFFGGTYFPKEKWSKVLQQVAHLYKKDYEKVLSYAQNLENGIKQNDEIIKAEVHGDFNESDLNHILNNWVNHLDDEEGGPNRVPKFSLPNNYKFLMRYAWQEKDAIIDDHIKLTLNKMADGGIYDQLGGGFARYSTDREWKVPHFEKMLYDNAQLVSLYSNAYKNYGDSDYKRIIAETLEFIEREMTNKVGLFYSAIDADSEGEEGKFYVWKKEEINQILGSEAPLFEDYYQINKVGFWEHGNYILMRNPNLQKIALKYDISIEEMELQIAKNKKVLMLERNKRIRPELDDKSLVSWNAMMITAYCDAYTALDKKEYRESAKKAMDFIIENMQKEDGGFWHTYKEGHSKINAYLDDYAFMIEALINLYQIGAGDKYLHKAQDIAQYTISKFFDKKSGMFFFTSLEDESLVSRKIEVFDNVIPASNSVMANNLFKLSLYFDNEDQKNISMQMLHNMTGKFSKYGSSLSNWGLLMMNHIGPLKEVVVCGNKAYPLLHKIQNNYLPNVIWAVDTKENNQISLLANRYVLDKTYIYVCENNTCQLPVKEVKEAMKIILNN